MRWWERTIERKMKRGRYSSRNKLPSNEKKNNMYTRHRMTLV